MSARGTGRATDDTSSGDARFQKHPLSFPLAAFCVCPWEPGGGFLRHGSGSEWRARMIPSRGADVFAWPDCRTTRSPIHLGAYLVLLGSTISGPACKVACMCCLLFQMCVPQCRPAPSEREPGGDSHTAPRCLVDENVSGRACGNVLIMKRGCRSILWFRRHGRHGALLCGLRQQPVSNLIRWRRYLIVREYAGCACCFI